jgi:hypothetical protein
LDFVCAKVCCNSLVHDLLQVCWNKLENQVNLLGCDPYVAWGKWIGSNVGSSLKFVIWSLNLNIVICLLIDPRSICICESWYWQLHQCYTMLKGWFTFSIALVYGWQNSIWFPCENVVCPWTFSWMVCLLIMIKGFFFFFFWPLHSTCIYGTFNLQKCIDTWKCYKDVKIKSTCFNCCGKLITLIEVQFVDVEDNQIKINISNWIDALHIMLCSLLHAYLLHFKSLLYVKI